MKNATIIEAITLDESKRLIALEKSIQEGVAVFVSVGNALAEIKESKLYRADFKTFEDYCQKRWNFSRIRAYQLIEAAEVHKALPENVKPGFTNAKALNALAKAPKKDRARIAAKVIKSVKKKGGKVTTDAVKSEVSKKRGGLAALMREPEPVQNTPHTCGNCGNKIKEGEEFTFLSNQYQHDCCPRDAQRGQLTREQVVAGAAVHMAKEMEQALADLRQAAENMAETGPVIIETDSGVPGEPRRRIPLPAHVTGDALPETSRYHEPTLTAKLLRTVAEALAARMEAAAGENQAEREKFGVIANDILVKPFMNRRVKAATFNQYGR